MPFIALCSACRAAKVRAPSKKRGTLATCPKCRAEFTLTPIEETEALPVDYRLPPVDFELGVVTSRNHPPLERAGAGINASMPLSHRGDNETAILSPLLSKGGQGGWISPPTGETDSYALAEVPIERTAPAPPPSVPIYEMPGEDAADLLPLKIALVGAGCFGVGMLATQFSYGRFAAVPLLLLGACLGFFSAFGLDDIRKRIGWGVTAVNLGGLVFVLLLPSWLGITGWVPPVDPSAGPKPVTAVGRDDNIAKVVEWVDANKAVWEQGDVRVVVGGVTLEPLDAKAKTPEARKVKVVRIALMVTNVGVARAVEFSGWVANPQAAPTLTDATGKTFAWRPTPEVPKPIYPGKAAEVTLVFDGPEKPGEWKLELPPTAFGGEAAVRFVVPAAMVR